MNSDLISREALKKATRELYKETPDGIVKFGIGKVYDLIGNAPAVPPKEICIAKIRVDEEQLQEVVDNAIIRCKNCKHQKKYWHEDKRMKEKGYWIYGCDLIDDSFVGTPVYGLPDQYCSSAERKVGRKK